MSTFVINMAKGRGARACNDDSPLSHSALKDELLKLKCDLKDELALIISNAVSGHVKQLEEKIAHQQKEIDNLKRYVWNSEKDKLQAIRKELASNLVISGPSESDFENSEELGGKVGKVLNFLDADLNKSTFRRVGRRVENKTRIVKVITGSVHERNRVLSKSRLLRNNPQFDKVYVDSDKCFLDRKELARLRGRARVLRNERPNSSVRLFRDKLFVDDDEVDHAEPLRHVLPAE